MQTISELKEQSVTDTPLLLVDCELSDGTTEHWSTHQVTVGSTAYAARVIRHNVFEIQAASDQGIDGIPRIGLCLANADAHFSQIERTKGLKGAKLTTRFVFYNLAADTPASNAVVVFKGICNPPDEITEATMRLSAVNRLNMQRLLFPQVRIQRRCGWDFPSSAIERAEALDGGADGKYSRFYRCGYSADVAGGSGKLNGSVPFTNCGYTRADCEARGLSEHFGGIEFVPPAIQVRTSGDKAWHQSAVSENTARYNDYVPVVYGTAWYTPPVVFARNDGNLTHMEVLLGIGEIAGVVKVLVNDVEVPLGRSGTNMTGTGWYNVPTLGTRNGGFNLDFLNSDGTPAGDAYGSMAYASVVVPNRISSGTSLPTVKVLIQGLKLPVYADDSSFVEERFTNNPSWILMDVLRRSGWSLDEMNVQSFAAAATYCDEQIQALDVNANPITLARFQSNLVIQKRRSAGDLIRGIRNAARMFLTYGEDGRLTLRVENTLALQQPTKPVSTNSTEPKDGGWPAYEFGDGTYGLSGILRKPNGEPSLRIWMRCSADTGNRIGVEFQDSLNQYQQDSCSIVDTDDVVRMGQEITAPLQLTGIPNYDQASRILKFTLDKCLNGNTYVEFSTSVKALGLQPGDIITLTYLREGFDRSPFRVVKIAPGANFGTAQITAQFHSDAWYSDTNGQAVGGGSPQTGAGLGVPKPLVGTTLDETGQAQLGFTEESTVQGDGGVVTTLSVSFAAPTAPPTGGPNAPMIDLTPTLGTGGSLTGEQTLYYAVSGIDGTGAEGPLSFIVRATLNGISGASVMLTGLSFSHQVESFAVYRGATPAQLLQIATGQSLAESFLDTGLVPTLHPAPDANFDHANFYWRMEAIPPVQATIHSPITVGNSSLAMNANQYRGHVVRVQRGKGAGQERAITGNTEAALTVAPKWDLEPDDTSYFSVSEAAWKFGATTKFSPAIFTIPNRPGETIEVCGRAANVNEVECGPELSPVSRWSIAGGGSGDTNVPSAPFFGFGEGKSGGSVEVSGVSFPTLANTKSIYSGTLTYYYWDELLGHDNHLLASDMDDLTSELDLTTAGTAEIGTFIQLEGEVLRVDDVLNNRTRYHVSRGMHGTKPKAHATGTTVWHLASLTQVMPFPPGFFGSPYSGDWTFQTFVPNARIASATLYVTNQYGSSPIGGANATNEQNFGLRTLSGGQYSLQVDGFLAVDANATPPLVIESSHAVRDVFASLGRAADGPVSVQVNMDGSPYCTITIGAGYTVSASVDGFTLPALPAGAQLTLSILSVGSAYPGGDLTVTIRL